MDVIALSQAGFRPGGGTLGTALTEEQIAELWRLVPEPTLCFDGDAAGERAAARAADRALPLLKPGQSLRFAMLPAGEDPDTLILAQGRGGHARGCWTQPCRWPRWSGGARAGRQDLRHAGAPGGPAPGSLSSSCRGSPTRACRRPIGPSSTPAGEAVQPGNPAAAAKARWVPRDERRAGGQVAGGTAGAGSAADPGRGGRSARRRRTQSGCAASGGDSGDPDQPPELIEPPTRGAGRI